MIHTRFCDERGVGIVISILSSQRIDSLRCVCVLVFVLCFLFYRPLVRSLDLIMYSFFL
jgi:hypothetical protein